MIYINLYCFTDTSLMFFSRGNPLTLIVALNGTDSTGGYAEGELFWDDGVSIGKSAPKRLLVQYAP